MIGALERTMPLHSFFSPSSFSNRCSTALPTSSSAPEGILILLFTAERPERWKLHTNTHLENRDELRARKLDKTHRLSQTGLVSWIPCRPWTARFRRRSRSRHTLPWKGRGSRRPCPALFPSICSDSLSRANYVESGLLECCRRPGSTCHSAPRCSAFWWAARIFQMLTRVFTRAIPKDITSHPFWRAGIPTDHWNKIVKHLCKVIKEQEANEKKNLFSVVKIEYRHWLKYR